MLNIEYQTTTLRLVKNKKDLASEILKSKGLTSTQYVNLALDRLVGSIPIWKKQMIRELVSRIKRGGVDERLHNCKNDSK